MSSTDNEYAIYSASQADDQPNIQADSQADIKADIQANIQADSQSNSQAYDIQAYDIQADNEADDIQSDNNEANDIQSDNKETNKEAKKKVRTKIPTKMPKRRWEQYFLNLQMQSSYLSLITLIIFSFLLPNLFWRSQEVKPRPWHSKSKQ